MFRKLIHIFLALSVIIATSGIVVSKHYCSGELKSVSFFKAKSCCGAAGEKPGGCCHTEFEIHNIDQDFNSGSGFVLENYSPEILVPLSLCVARLFSAELPRENKFERLWPPLPDPPLYLQFQVFLI